MLFPPLAATHLRNLLLTMRYFLNMIRFGIHVLPTQFSKSLASIFPGNSIFTTVINPEITTHHGISFLLLGYQSEYFRH